MMPKSKTRTTLRTRVSAAFQAMARGVDAKQAYARTKAFYRSRRPASSAAAS